MRPERAIAISHDRRRRFITLLSVGAFAMLALMGYLIWLSYREAIQTAETTSRNYAAIIEARLDASLRRADASLLQLTHMPVAALNKEAIPRYAGELAAALDLEMADFPELIGLRIFGANGDQFYSSNDGFGTAPNIAERRFFRQARESAPGDLVISEVVRGSNTGVSFITVVRALRDEQGRFMGVAAANFNLDYFQNLFRSLDLGPQGVLAILRTEDFTQVIRWPQINNILNRQLPLNRPVRSAAARGIKLKTVELKFVDDGISRITTFTFLDNYPFFVTAALAVDDVLAGWRIRSLAVSLFALLLLILLTGLLARLWHAEAKQEQVVSELTQSEERYVLAVNGVNEGIWDWNIITDDAYLSSRWKQLLGYRDDELENKSSTFFDRIHPDDVEKAKDAVEAHFKDNAPYAVEVRLRLKDESYHWFLARGEAHRDAMGRPVRMVGSINDITERKEAEDKLRESKALLAQAQETARLGSWDLDLASNRLLWSDEIYRIFEIDRDRFAALYEAFLAAIHPDDRDMVDKAYTESLANKTPYQIVHRLKMSDGRIKWVEERCQTWYDAHNKPLRSMGTVQDVTERVLAEQKLLNSMHEAEAANKAKSSFLASMSHELRTPLNAILGFSEVIGGEMMGPVGTPIYREYAGHINNSGKHLLAIINDVLDMARIGSGQFVLKEDYVDLGEVIECCLPMVQQMATANSIALQVIPNTNLPLLWADRKRLNQILINLLSNAVKFTPNGGTVSVEAHVCGDGSLALIVADTGIGMTPEQVHTAMQPFRQVDSTLGRKYDGTGLGLPLTEGLMNLHGGRLEITSETGVGTVVTALFPVSRVRHSRGDRNYHDDVLQSVERISA